MNWRHISSADDLETIIDRSRVVPCLIFKHSTRCPISSMAKNRLEASWDLEEDIVEPYFIDLIRHRDLSNRIADRFAVAHESPQVLLIKDGICSYDASHLNIRVDNLRPVAG